MVRGFDRSVIVFVAILIASIVLMGTLQSAHAEELSAKERAALQAEYDQVQREIEGLNAVIADTQAKKGTLQGDVAALDAQIKQAEAQIRQKNLVIKKLGDEISAKTSRIHELTSKIDQGKEALASMIRRTDQIDDLSLVEVALGTDTAFDLFEDVDHMATLQANLKTEFGEIRSAKAETESERQLLSSKQTQENDAKYAVETQKTAVNQTKTEKNQLLTITTNQETQYKQVLADRQAKAASIRARLFPLRDAAAIKFEDAIRLAKAAESATGVRAAFILGELRQESNLGANVGQCYLTNSPNMGDGVGKNTGTPFSGLMKPTRDVEPFVALSKRLGFDPYKQVVSCAQAGGYGGAMGPAQFIPSTWVAYESRIQAAVGHTPNPWDAGDAIMAMALYLADLGASAGGYTAEHTAAAKYYAGGAWATSGQGYATSVLNYAAQYQQDIDFLKDN